MWEQKAKGGLLYLCGVRETLEKRDAIFIHLLVTPKPIIGAAPSIGEVASYKSLLTTRQDSTQLVASLRIKKQLLAQRLTEGSPTKGRSINVTQEVSFRATRAPAAAFAPMT